MSTREDVRDLVEQRLRTAELDLNRTVRAYEINPEDRMLGNGKRLSEVHRGFKAEVERWRAALEWVEDARE